MVPWSKTSYGAGRRGVFRSVVNHGHRAGAISGVTEGLRGNNPRRGADYARRRWSLGLFSCRDLELLQGERPC